MTIDMCPVYKAKILPDENNNCSLCGAPNQHQEIPNGNDDILWVGFDETDLEMIESAMSRVLESSGNSIARRRAQDVLVTIESARNGDWTP